MLRRTFWLCVSACCVAACLLPVSAQEKKPAQLAALNEKDAGPDFQIQGEYSGELGEGNEKIKFGIQIIALGDAKFRAVAYHGGLPGDGWNREAKIETDGQVEGGVLRFVQPEKGSAELKDGKLAIFNKDKVAVGELSKVLRKSETIGKPAPADAIVLFDGKTADQFTNGRIEDGLLVQGITSKQKFDSFSLHLEFMLSFMPHARGQGRANSGCYMQGRYETQILDSFGLEGKDNECGGIYTIKSPSQNMCFPPLSWQTYDVEYTAAKYEGDKKIENARMTVLHNGVKIHDNVELPKGTTAAPVKEGPESGPIYIQDHGNPIRFRNIWLVPTK